MFPAGRFIHRGGEGSQAVGAYLSLAVSAVDKVFLNGAKEEQEREREKRLGFLKPERHMETTQSEAENK